MYQGLQEEGQHPERSSGHGAYYSLAAEREIQAMVKCSDFDRKMLLLATQIAHEGDMKTLLLGVLETLLAEAQKHMSDAVTESLVLIRCIVRLILNLLKEPTCQRSVSCRRFLLGIIKRIALGTHLFLVWFDIFVLVGNKPLRLRILLLELLSYS